MKNIKHDDYKRCILSNAKEDRQQIVNFNLIRRNIVKNRR